MPPRPKLKQNNNKNTPHKEHTHKNVWNYNWIIDGINISRAVHILILIIFTQDYETNGRLDQFVILDFPVCPNHSNKKQTNTHTQKKKHKANKQKEQRSEKSTNNFSF